MEGVILISMEFGWVVYDISVYNLQKGKCYMGFIFEREENEWLEQLTCVAIGSYHMEHQKGTSSWKSFFSWLTQKLQTESMALQGKLTALCNRRLSSKQSLLDFFSFPQHSKKSNYKPLWSISFSFSIV